MHFRASKKLFLTIGALVGFLVISAGYFVFAGRRSLDNSVQVLLHDHFRLKYSIEGKAVGDSIVDLGGEWRVRIDGLVQGSPTFVSMLSRSDTADLEFFKRILRDKLSIVDSLDGFELYRTQLKLGTGTICETNPCKIYVLQKDGHKNIYVGIYKN